MRAAQLRIKRLMDLAGATLGLAIGFPIIGLAAVAIWFEDRGPIFFCQARVGEGGKSFMMYKLRSMRAANQNTPEDLFYDRTTYQSPTKVRFDPRITTVGRFLRRWSIDEIPQFVNVLKGEMSLVGPRPEEVRIVSQYPFSERLRLTVRPGITGPMQVNGRADLTFYERSRLELDYLNNYSSWLDIKILLQTIIAVINGKGSY
jgi:lipopolysaccharide/colanic/teichoic acid biosynthesis glycosyltransferase